ncbi:Osmotic avoidance abnormal protein, putative [Entamoeba invadens IP1]|uniref:Osmotic avoidance abnormal protein, putative n=1 Tax=Entamoeba invadens IP1 TaxID=370355 RepID=UPI0002C3EABE|nr:Osmotic avoidance abnormal protein, putative [Entamoeba invadens IP1]ELP93991.1 Osmotic avoidance abnormal protein, putative [Entamoeba invadens IP1]|eukprot:XP_004260762.1 Osmotic avoidance abnormal protein, putative [Entamoeba invadens IP1]
MNIKVYVRIRPLKKDGHSEDIKTSPRSVQIRDKKFSFDGVFPMTTDQQTFYTTALNGFIPQVIEGYNCTFFAYGQTGTGKTFTMEGEEKNEGVIPRLVFELFDVLEKKGLKYVMKVTHIEIYNEKVFDLLSQNKEELFVRERKSGGGCAPVNATEMTVTRDNVREILARSTAQRTTAQTDLNPNSSRSHCIFTVIVQIATENMIEGPTVRIGRINCVDLAGSENCKRAGVLGDKVKQIEGMAINQSLLVLNRVIMGLSKGDKYIPYRSSALTRILADALGGKSVTAMVATISPEVEDEEETLSSLDYAKRVNTIKNSPKQNEGIRKDVFFQKKLEKIGELKRMINEGKEGDKQLSEEDIENLRNELSRVNRKNQEMQLLFAAAKGEVEVAKSELKNAVSYIESKKQDCIELKTILKKVVSSVIVLTEECRRIEEVYRKNQDKIKMSENSVKDRRTSVIKQCSDIQQGVSMVEDVKQKLCGEGKKMEEVQQPIKLVSGVELERVVPRKLGGVVQAQFVNWEKDGRNAIEARKRAFYKDVEEIKTVYKEIQKKKDEIEALKNMSKQDEEQEKICFQNGFTQMLESIQSETKRIENASVENTKMEEDEEKEFEQKKRERNEAVQRSIAEGLLKIQKVIDQIGVEVGASQSFYENWLSDKIETRQKQISDEKKKIVFPKIHMKINEIETVMTTSKTKRQELEEKMQREMTAKKAEIKEKITLSQTAFRKISADVEEDEAKYEKGCKKHVANIMTYVDGAIGSDGFSVLLKRDINNIGKEMARKEAIGNTVCTECELLCSSVQDRFGVVKEQMCQMETGVDGELYELEGCEQNRVELPLTTFKGRTSVVPSFGKDLNEQIKKMDEL